MKKQIVFKVLSLALSLSLLVSMLIPCIGVSAADTIVNWDGTRTQPLGGGTTEDPYLITNAEELAYAVTTSASDSTYYKLANDIYINDDSAENWYEDEGLVSWPDDSVGKFRGTLDGDGHKVYGLYHSSGGTSALVPRIEAGSSVKNIGIESAFISGNIVGGIFGDRQWANGTVALVENCYVGENVILVGQSAAGGIYGWSRKGYVTIKNCYSLAQLYGTFGGISGDQWGGTVTFNSCYTNSNLTGKNQSLSLTNCYSIGTAGTILTVGQMQGNVADDNMSGLDFKNTYLLTDSYPVLRAFYKSEITCFDSFDGTSAVKTIYPDTTIDELTVPYHQGYEVEGFYADAEMTQKIESGSIAKDYSNIYIKWQLASIEDVVTNSYDDEGVTFTEEPYDKNMGTKSSMNAKENYGFLSTYDAVVKEGIGLNGTRGLKVTRAYSYAYTWQTAVVLYDANGDAFLPDANSTYRVSLKYNVNKLNNKAVNIALRRMIDGKTSVNYNAAYTYGNINNSPIAGSAEFQPTGWVSDSLVFTTGDTVTPLYLAFVATENSNWGVDGLEMYVDDIVIEKLGYVECNITENEKIDVPVYATTTFAELTTPTRYGYTFDGFYTNSSLTVKAEDDAFVKDADAIYVKWSLKTVETPISNTYDETNISINTAVGGGYSSSNINGTQISQFDARVEENCGINNSKAMKITSANTRNYKWTPSFMLYKEDGTLFTPNANTTYRISLKYKIDNTVGGDTAKDIYLALRQSSNNAMSTDYTNRVEYGNINSTPVIRGTSTGDNWISEDMVFTTTASPQNLYISVITNEAGATDKNSIPASVELYIDDISIITYEIPNGLIEGDANNDGLIDIRDLVKLKKMSVGLSAITWAGDVDGDSQIATSSDLVWLRKELLGVNVVEQTKGERQLVWSEEFNGTEINGNTWNFSQVMTTENTIYDNTRNHVAVENGKLNLMANKAGDTYSTSKGITTQNGMLFKFGYLEIRAKMPYVAGAWPSIWMLTNENHRTTDYRPEIDIVETMGDPTSFATNLHYRKGDSEEDGFIHDSLDKSNSSIIENLFQQLQEKRKHTFADTAIANEYHIYGFEWDETYMTFYVDGVEHFKYDYTTFAPKDTDGYNIFHDPFFLIINNEIHYDTIDNASETPFEYNIDWIRLYQNTAEGSNETLLTGDQITK